MKLNKYLIIQLNSHFLGIINGALAILLVVNLVFWNLPHFFAKSALAGDLDGEKFISETLRAQDLSLIDQNNNYLIIDNFIKVNNVPSQPIKKIKRVIITAYSSTVDQTDDTPFITASGTAVKDGVVAANFLEFGAKIQIPEVFGDKTFIVEDRMAPKNNHKVDIWFPDKESALEFGVKATEVLVIE